MIKSGIRKYSYEGHLIKKIVSGVAFDMLSYMMIWILVALIICTYFLFLYTCYGSSISRIFLNVDQAHFKSIVFSLEKHWALFPASLENISNIGVPYHNLDSQFKWLFTFCMSTNTAFFVVNFMIYSFLGYSILKLNFKGIFSILILLFAVSMLKLPSSGEILKMVHMPLNFTIRSDIFHNTNTVLALALLTFVWKKSFFIRLIVYFLSFYAKSPAVPAFFLIELYLLFFSDKIYGIFPFKNRFVKLFVVILIFLLSYYCFFYSFTYNISGYMDSAHWVNFRINKNIIWLANGALVYDSILLLLTLLLPRETKNNRILEYFYCAASVFLIVYDSIGLVKINIDNFGQVEFFLRYALLIIILSLSSNVLYNGHEADMVPQRRPPSKYRNFYFKKAFQEFCIETPCKEKSKVYDLLRGSWAKPDPPHDSYIKNVTNKLLAGLIMAIIIFNCYFFAQFAGALVFRDYHRFSEYLDNCQLLKIVSFIANKNDVVAFNTISSPIRKNKQLQLCGIIKNPLWVSNLSYVTPIDRDKVTNDWKLLELALHGKQNFPDVIKWLILDKTNQNYNLKIIRNNFFIVKETKNYILLERHKTGSVSWRFNEFKGQ